MVRETNLYKFLVVLLRDDENKSVVGGFNPFEKY